MPCFRRCDSVFKIIRQKLHLHHIFIYRIIYIYTATHIIFTPTDIIFTPTVCLMLLLISLGILIYARTYSIIMEIERERGDLYVIKVIIKSASHSFLLDNLSRCEVFSVGTITHIYTLYS